MEVVETWLRSGGELVTRYPVATVSRSPARATENSQMLARSSTPPPRPAKKPDRRQARRTRRARWRGETGQRGRAPKRSAAIPAAINGRALPIGNGKKKSRRRERRPASPRLGRGRRRRRR